jgi:hypothetical protein
MHNYKKIVGRLFFDDIKKQYFFIGPVCCDSCSTEIDSILFIHAKKNFLRSPEEINFFCMYCINKAKEGVFSQRMQAIVIYEEIQGLIPILRIPFGVGDNAKFSSAFDAVKAESEKTIDNTRYAFRYESIGGAQIGKNPTEVIEQLDRNMGTEEGLNFLNNLATATPLIEEKKDAKPIIKSEEERRDIKC